MSFFDPLLSIAADVKFQFRDIDNYMAYLCHKDVLFLCPAEFSQLAIDFLFLDFLHGQQQTYHRGAEHSKDLLLGRLNERTSQCVTG